MDPIVVDLASEVLYGHSVEDERGFVVLPALQVVDVDLNVLGRRQCGARERTPKGALCRRSVREEY